MSLAKFLSSTNLQKWETVAHLSKRLDMHFLFCQEKMLNHFVLHDNNML